MANKARERRKAMLGARLEPVVKTVIRQPYDTSVAKSGVVHFLDADDNVVAAVTIRQVDIGSGAYYRLKIRSRHEIRVATQEYPRDNEEI